MLKMSEENKKDVSDRAIKSMKTDDSTKVVSRREFQSVIGGGITVSALGKAGKLFDFDETSIPILRTPEGVAKWRKVPTSWYEHIQIARSAVKKIQEQFMGHNDIFSIGRTSAEDKIHGHFKDVIFVEVDPNGSISVGDIIANPLPQQVDGIEVRLVEGAKKKVAGSGCMNRRDFNSMPGGVTVGPDGSSSDDGGTSGYTVKDSSGNWYMVTAAHLWPSVCSSDINGANAYQSGRYLGSVALHDTSKDIALIATNSDITFDDQIKEQDGRRDVKGWVTADGHDEFKSVSGDAIHAIGITSGSRYGYVDATDVSSQPANYPCIDLDGHGVKYTTTVAQGDSGGPYYWIGDNGGAWISSHVSSGSTLRTSWNKYCDNSEEFNDSFGMPAHYLANKGYEPF